MPSHNVTYDFATARFNAIFHNRLRFMLNVCLTIIIFIFLKWDVLSQNAPQHNADFTKYESFRPISNLKFVSKLVEKAVCVQLTDYITSNGLSETFQSAYKSFHSTETALLRV